ncbi:hypothetical protein TCON_1546 [Astathelohania contejeani]|uniref:Uncharacterized protein n=1 Tax=Astathelohania contejeani TaxID=164912 RepID=A0ABQ7HYM8_9MICR|nr:hypothetical protein TCON_1546 [Thelohania contejeani]
MDELSKTIKESKRSELYKKCDFLIPSYETCAIKLAELIDINIENKNTFSDFLISFFNNENLMISANERLSLQKIKECVISRESNMKQHITNLRNSTQVVKKQNTHREIDKFYARLLNKFDTVEKFSITKVRGFLYHHKNRPTTKEVRKYLHKLVHQKKLIKIDKPYVYYMFNNKN